ncbi:MAG TPA: Gfo/Idh/MocA family oxidoreductase [Vicinamibacterales bacterium]|nr:Gfo/Idh/MocA family oxidoreductase [Vicinamibacterales bacterium]
MLNAGLIGYGYWGPNLARNLADAFDAVRLTAIADARPERRQAAARRHPGVVTFADADALLASDVDAVVIATPLRTHTALVEAAISRGKHVLVEKPIAPSRKDAEALAELAETRGVCLMVDHTFVYTGAVKKIRSLIDSGDLGQLLYLDSVRVNLGLFQQDSNVIWDLAVHDLSVMDYLIESRPVAVSADGSCVAGYEHENIAYITVHFDNGFLAHFHVNWLAPVKIRHMLLGGSQRMLVYNDMEPSEKVLVYDKGVDVNVDIRDDVARRQILVSYRTGDMYAPKLDRTEALAGVVREFANAITERRAPLTGAASGIHVVSLLEAAEQSLRSEGRRIRL